MKTFYPTYFKSNSILSLALVEADSRKEAIERYAQFHQVLPSSYIATKRPTTDLNQVAHIIYKSKEA